MDPILDSRETNTFETIKHPAMPKVGIHTRKDWLDLVETVGWIEHGSTVRRLFVCLRYEVIRWYHRIRQKKSGLSCANEFLEKKVHEVWIVKNVDSPKRLDGRTRLVARHSQRHPTRSDSLWVRCVHGTDGSPSHASTLKHVPCFLRSFLLLPFSASDCST